MEKAKKKLLTTISVSGVCIIIIIAITLGLVLPNVQFAYKNHELFGRAREILLQNFTPSELGAKTKLKRTINNENPLNLINYYGDEPLLSLWNSIPSNQKPFTVILLVPGQILNYNSENSLQNLETWANECESNEIPYIIQNINGETHMEARAPIAYLEENFAAKHKYFYGLNAAELYNGVEWRGTSESDNSLYIIELIKLCAKYGAFFVWTDTNRNYENGMLLEWLENNESFYSAFKNYSEFICLLNKESFGHPSTYAVMEGLWLAGLIGNWGVASDWWHWQCDGDKKSLFGENDKYVDDEWEMIFSFPENMYVQSMMLVMSRGGTCFKAEAPNFSTSYNGKPLAGFEYGISPLLNRIISGDICIPTKEQVFAVTDFAVLGKQNYSKANYNFSESNLYPAKGKSGIVPLLPVNLRKEERKALLDKGIRLIDNPLSDGEFMELYGNNDADTYLTKAGTDWYYINNVENERKRKYASFAPDFVNAESFYIESDEHCSAIISEKNYGFKVYLSNYRTDKINMYKTGTPEERRELGWAKYVYGYLGLDEFGDPLGVSDKTLRKTIIKVVGEYNGGKPIIKFNNLPDGSGNNNRKFKYNEIYDSINKELTITIEHNGIIDLQIMTDECFVESTPIQKKALSDAKTINNNNVNKLIELTREKIIDNHNYTYFSYLEYDKAFEKAKVIVHENTYSEEEINIAVNNLVQAKDNLIEISKERELLQAVLSIKERSDKLNIAYDSLLRELCSSKKYIYGRSNNLTYAEFYKNTNIINEILKKPRYISNKYNALKKIYDSTI